MPEPPLFDGEPVSPRDDASRAGASRAGDSRAGWAALPVAAMGEPVDDVPEWVGFDEPEAAPDKAGEPLGLPLPAVAPAAVAPPAVAPPAVAPPAVAWWRRPLPRAAARLVRVGLAVASMSALAVFAYQTSGLRGGVAAATPRLSGSAPSRGPAVVPDGAPAPVLATAPATGTVPNPAAVPASAPPPVARPGDLAVRAAFYLKRAMAGDAAAQYDVGVLYALGDGVDRDFASAALWFREAAANGSTAAQFNLAVMYDRALGLRQDHDQALVWYRRAADRGDARAQYNLAVAYEQGWGTPPDPVAAARWYHQAAEQGLMPAIFNFAILYEKGAGVQQSPTAAFAWYWAGAQRGDTAAGKRAGDLFQGFAAADKRQAQIQAAAVASSIRAPITDAAATPLDAPPLRLEAVPMLKSGLKIQRP